MIRARLFIPILLLSILPLYGANKTFTDLPAVSSVGTGDEFPTWQSSTAKKATAEQLKTFVGGRTLYLLASDYTNSTTTGTQITGIGPMTIAGSSGSYYLDCELAVQSAATTTGWKFGVNYTGTTTLLAAKMLYASTGTTAATGVGENVVANNTGSIYEASAASAASTTAPNLGPTAGVAAINTNVMVALKALVTISATGDLEVWAGSEIASSQITVKAGSFCAVTPLQ